MVESRNSSDDIIVKEKSSPSKRRKASKSSSTGKKRSVTKKKAAKKVKAAKKAKKVIKYDPTEHFMVPKHEIVDEKEKEMLVKKYGTLDRFPKILLTDPIVEKLGAKEGDLIRIYREEGIYYRYVVGPGGF